MLLPLEKWAEYPRVSVNHRHLDLTERRAAGLKRFWEAVDVRSPNECWNWIGCIIPSGYGQFLIYNTRIRAHRFSLYVHGTEIPKGMFACHHCDNKRCVNPNHLYVGTCADNNRDAMERGQNPVVYKISPETRIEIERLNRQGISERKLAVMFKTSRTTIVKILKTLRKK